MKRIILTLTILILFALSSQAGAADYTIATGTTTFDGDTDCGGAACTSADTIIIAGGARGRLLIQDVDGDGTGEDVEQASYRIAPSKPSDLFIHQGDWVFAGVGQNRIPGDHG